MTEREADRVAPGEGPDDETAGTGAEARTDRRSFLRLAGGGAVAATVAGVAAAEPAGALHVEGIRLGHNNFVTSDTTRIFASQFGDEKAVVDIQADDGTVALRAGGRPNFLEQLISSPAIGLWGEVDSATAPSDVDANGVGAPTVAGVYAVGHGTAAGVHAQSDIGKAVHATSNETAVAGEGRTGVYGRSTDGGGYGVQGEDGH